MTHLALNTVLPQMLRVKYQVAIGVAPIGLMFASFFPTIFVAGLLSERATGGVWLSLFLASMVICMLLGYSLGWLVNLAVARVLLGWSRERVSAVFSRSEVPPHWLKDADATATDATARSIERWEQVRKVGAFRFILTRGLVGWGVPMFGAIYVGPTLFGSRQFSLDSLALNVILWGIAGVGFGAIIWYASELNYRRLLKRREA
jgi:hypothetical protein